MQLRDSFFEPFVQGTRAGDVSRTARAGPVGCHCIARRRSSHSKISPLLAHDLHNRLFQLGMLTEAKVIVAAPDGDRTRIGRVRLFLGSWKVSTLPLDAFEHAVGIVTFLRLDLLVEECRVLERIGLSDVEN